MTVYSALGYNTNSQDIVDITYDLFQYFGEGYEISSSNATMVSLGASSFYSNSQVPSLNYSRILIPPYNLQATPLNNQSIQLTWTLPNGTDDYNIKIYNNGILLNNFSATDSYIISGLSANTTYCFQVSLFCNSTGEESSKSSEVCATTNANPPPPPINWIIEDNRFTTRVDSNTNEPTDTKNSYEKSAGKYVNYWVRLKSSDPNLNFEWRLYFTFDNSRFWNAQTSSNQPAYLCQSYSSYDAANQEYRIWHKIEANTLSNIGQYRTELWINSQKASNCCFDLTLETPYYLKLNGEPFPNSVNLIWPTLGSNTAGSGVEVFRDNTLLFLIPGSSHGFTDTATDNCKSHDYRIRSVEVYPAGTFRSPFSQPLNVTIKLRKVGGSRISQ